MYAFQINYNFSGILQSFGDHAAQGGGFIAIYDAAFAMHNHDVSEMTGFQTQFQLRLLGSKWRGMNCLPIDV